jgi:hypothetical protein
MSGTRKETHRILDILHALRGVLEQESFQQQKQIAEMLLIVFQKKIQCHEWDCQRLKYLEDVIAQADPKVNKD